MHGEVEQDHEAERPHEHADTAEQVKWPVAIAAHERDAEQVEEAAHVPLRAVPRATVLARTVVDRNLRDAEPAIRRENRDEAMQLSVQAHALKNLGAVRLQPAVDVV